MFACCLSEYLLRAHDWVHMSDNSREAGSLCQVKSNNKLFVDDWKMLFTGGVSFSLAEGFEGLASRPAAPYCERFPFEFEVASPAVFLARAEISAELYRSRICCICSNGCVLDR